MNTTSETMENAPAVQAISAINNRINMDACARYKDGRSYIDERYPKDLLRQIDCHWPDNFWFGFTFKPSVFHELAVACNSMIKEPFDVGTPDKPDFKASPLIIDVLTSGLALDHWQEVEEFNTPGEKAFRFTYFGRVLGYRGICSIDDILSVRDKASISVQLYDPTEKGSVILDYQEDFSNIQFYPRTAYTYLILICGTNAEGKLYAKSLTVGWPDHLSEYGKPWSNEICNGRTISLTEAKHLGYTHVQFSRNGAWRTALRKDPS